jgi:hypothetical protein
MNYSKDDFEISSFITDHTTETYSSIELALLEEFYERTRSKELIKEDKIKKSLKRFNRHEPLNTNTGKKRR